MAATTWSRRTSRLTHSMTYGPTGAVLDLPARARPVPGKRSRANGTRAAGRRTRALDAPARVRSPGIRPGGSGRADLLTELLELHHARAQGLQLIGIED